MRALFSGRISRIRTFLFFFQGWRNAASSGKACFNDITSISSYSHENEMVGFGFSCNLTDTIGVIPIMFLDHLNL